jgi:hypothetical protein
MRVKDVLPEGIDQRALMYISQAKHADFSRSRVVPGNVLMTIAGRVGTAAVFPADLVEGNITGHIVGIELPDTILENNRWRILSDYVTAMRSTQSIANVKQAISYYPVQGMENDPYSTEEQVKFSSSSEVNGLCLSCQPGDVLIARLGPCLINKKSVVVTHTENDSYCSPEFLVVTPQTGVDSRFILWAVKSGMFLEQMLPKTTGATPSRLRLHETELLKMKVPKATTDQQRMIGAELERRRSEARRLHAAADKVVAEAKAKVERMILGEEAAV